MQRAQGGSAGRAAVGGGAALVGRGAEVRQLAAALDRAARRVGGALLLAGEAGIGKTRLAGEALVLARARGFLTLEGRAYPLADSLAYAPLLDAFGGHLRSLDPGERAALVAGLADLGRLFAGLRLPAPEPLGNPALEKTRLFDAVARLLERLARGRPVLLFVDDLHWADPASLELLHYLAAGLAGQPVLLLATYRTEEVSQVRGLRVLLQSLRRAGLFEQVELARLDRSAVAELARELLRGEPPLELLRLLEGRAGGTPLFIGALIRALVEAGQLIRSNGDWLLLRDRPTELPPGVRELILERLDHLDQGERRVIDLVALYGEATPHAVLAAVGGLSEDDLLAAVRRLLSSGLLREELARRDVAYDVGHPLMREVAQAELPEMVRRRAHAAIAAALERLRSADLERLARHYQAADREAPPQRALEVLLAAGERAGDLFANAEAARYLGAALDLVRSERATLPEGRSLALLLEGLGQGRERIGEIGGAIAAWSEALADHERTGDTAAAARVHWAMALAEWDRGQIDSALTHLDAGVAALAGDEGSPEWVDLMYARIACLSRVGDLEATAAATAELTAVAERLGTPRALAAACLVRSGLALERGALLEAPAYAEAGLAAAGENEPLQAQRLHEILALMRFLQGDHRRARRHAEQGLALARRLGAPTLELVSRARLINAHTLSGDWSEALRQADEAVRLARRVDQPCGLTGVLAAQVPVLVRRGDLHRADAVVAEANAIFEGSSRDSHIRAHIDFGAAALALERGDLAAARAATQVFDPTQPPGPGVLSVMHVPLGLALLAETQVLGGEPERALETARLLARQGSRDWSYPTALAERAVGLARRTQGDTAATEAALARAFERFEALDLPFETAQARLERAELLAPSEPESAAEAVQAGLAAFQRLEATRYVERARRLLQQLGQRPPAPPGPRPAGPLSVRELEVARLVADGLTTAQIAERLSLSPRTVTTHLDRIYTRLGIGSRAALVRYVTEAGLLADDVIT